MLKTEIVPGELPYRIQIDQHLYGAGVSPAKAVVAALGAGGLIPDGERDPRAILGRIFWQWQNKPDWVRLVHILEKDTFDE